MINNREMMDVLPQMGDHMRNSLVSGQMRLQPYGPMCNPTHHKLIYIKPYTKKPYVRRGNAKLG